MSNFGTVRELARAMHQEARNRANDRTDAVSLLAAARAAEGIKTVRLPASHPLLAGGDGALHREARTIYLCDLLGEEQAAFVEAHEFGHWWIETPSSAAIVLRGADPGTPEESSPLGLRRVEAYSPQELRERHANVFAREFLLPRSEVRRLFIDEGHSAGEIAVALGLPIGLVYQQSAAALLVPESSAVAGDTASAEPPPLDASQRAAAEHTGAPLLVEAGPGTGKTRTLIARVVHLLGRGVAAPFILTLTFSNKAANEIRARVAAAAPLAAPELWAGTFHAFGLELIRKYGHLENIAEPIKLLDQPAALALLESELPALGLDHYLRLHEPLVELKHILSAIQRAKDEVCSPAEYAAAAARMQAAAVTDEQRVRADKMAEVARAFAHYESRLREAGLVDFPDLIARPVEILRRHPDVLAEVRRQYAHILVDEYQDVNRASALLLKELAGNGDRLWVVGDARQSIYRFRGAAPLNTRDFEKDYPRGERKSLAVNYRSRKQIVDSFGAYASGMRTSRGRGGALLRAERGTGVDVIGCNIATDREAEIAGVAAAIAQYRERGIAYREQAVLCRSHAHLERIARGLEGAGIPVLYLGDLFERPEVRDLLAILSFIAEPHRGGLYRVATLPSYRMPLADVRAVLTHAAAADKPPIRVLNELHLVPGLSETGCAALERLRLDLAPFHFRTGPGVFLCELLFQKSRLLRDYLFGDTVADQQRRLAIHQFLQFAIENNSCPDGEDPKRALLDWIRRLEVLGDEMALREPTAAVDGIDAVRLMTVHASKGLEFRAVHLPTLGAGMFPARRQGQRCPAPDGVLATAPADDHEEEEECLFFVALSRARDHLSLSRAVRYSERQNSNASEALMAIAAHLPRSPDGLPNWTRDRVSVIEVEAQSELAVTAREHDGRDVELYLNCPRRYLYQVVLGLSGSRNDTAYVRFHRAVYKVLRWLAEQPGGVNSIELLNELDARWQEIGPGDHPLDALYRSAALRIVTQAHGRPRAGIRLDETLSLRIADHVLRLPIDEIEGAKPGGIIARRLRTGRAPQRPDQRMLHALLLQAARQNLGDNARLELHYLTTSETVDPGLSDRIMASRLGDCRDCLEGLAAGRFPAVPADREDCPRCAHYFICPAIPD